jgi:tetratricopeptide (TPR) repeat protein
LISAALSVAVHAEAPAHPQAAVKAFNAGVQQFNAKKFSEAISLFDEAISDDDNFAEAYYARAACRHYLKSTDGALMDLSDAIRIKSDLLDARALRGAVYYETDRWDQALEDFSYVLERRPSDPQSLLGRGVIRLKREDSPGAVHDFKAFIKARPDDPLVPRLRQLLVSLHAPVTPAEAGAQAPPSEQPVAKRKLPRNSSNTALRKPSEASMALANQILLNFNDLSENFGKKVLRGERAEAVGDIHKTTGESSSSSQDGQ